MHEFHRTDVAPVVFPSNFHVKLSADAGALLTDLSLYRKLIGKLNSLQYTRLDISVFYTRVTLCLNQGFFVIKLASTSLDT